MIFTHCGLLGDFLLTLPVASWYFKKTGEKIDFVLPLIDPFKGVDELLIVQEFTKSVTFVDFQVVHFGYGGQPFNLNPADYGMTGEFINFGYSGYESLPAWSPYSHAMEHGMGVDEEFLLNIEDDIDCDMYYDKTVIGLPILFNEFNTNKDEMDKREWGTYMLLNYSPIKSTHLDNSKSLYDNLKICKAAKLVYCSDGGLSIALDLMKKNFVMFYKNRQVQPFNSFERYFFRSSNEHRSVIVVNEDILPKSGKKW